MATPNDLLNFGTAYGNLLGVTPEADFMSGFTPEQQTLLKEIQQRQQPVNPFQSIFDKKDANIQAQQDLLKKYQNLSQQRTRSAFVNPEANQKGFLDALKDPTEAQRNAFIAFGLGLASSTGDVSQRLGTALGQGVGALQKTRAQDRARELQGLQFEGQQLGLERKNLAAEFEQAKFFEQRAQQLRKQERDDILFTQGQLDRTQEQQRQAVIDQRNARAAEIKELELLAKQNERKRLPNTFLNNRPIFQNFSGEPVFIDGTPLTEDQVQKVQRPKPEGGSLIFDSETNTFRVASGAINKSLEKADSQLYNQIREGANEAAKVLSSLDTMEAYLDEGVDTGPGTGFRRLAGRASEAIEGLTGGTIDLPFDQLERQQQLGILFSQQAKTQAIENLRAFGGSDTERELQISLEIQPSLDYTEEENRQIIRNKKAAIRILLEKEDFYTKWINETGGLTNLKNGISVSDAWRKFQKDNFTKEDITGIPESDLKLFETQADLRLKSLSKPRLISEQESIQKALNAIR
tara:strand:+ start:1226 stop:2788 length:1563 start_codon:yes stop_codon:yes gene_type:complete